jgi:Photosynthetic reaction centre cytochrome C subunit
MRSKQDCLMVGTKRGAIISLMQRVWNLFPTLAAMAILATVLAPQTPLNAQAKGAGKNAPKNLKVLTPENFMAQMQTFPVALGVESQGGCNFCHEADRSLDTKPTKVKARQMIEMVADINAKFGDGQTHVTCWTCHLGSTKPEIARIPKR